MATICGDYEYELLADETAEVVYKGKDAHVVVPKELDGHAVSSIRYYGFNWMETLESVVLPEGLKKIGNFAFHHCDHLIRVDIPQSVEQLGNNVFDGCEALTDIRLPAGLTRIEDGMFEHCRNLERIEIPETVREICDSAFYACSSLKEVAIPCGVRTIGTMAFAHCSQLEHIEIPSSVRSIGNYAFSDCSALAISAPQESVAWQYAVSNGIPTDVLISGDYKCCVEPEGTISIMRYLGHGEEVIIPAAIRDYKVSAIRRESFFGHPQIRQVIISDGIECIRQNAFLHCTALEIVQIPSSVQTIEAAAFLGCHALQGIRISPDNGAYTVCGGALYTKDMETLVAWPQASGTVSVADGVKRIETEAFALCRRLRGVKLPQSLEFIGLYAFNWCTELDDIVFPEGLKRVEGFAFHQCRRLEGRKLPNGERIKIH